jgi:hypothetical protein
VTVTGWAIARSRETQNLPGLTFATGIGTRSRPAELLSCGLRCDIAIPLHCDGRPACRTTKHSPQRSTRSAERGTRSLARVRSGSSCAAAPGCRPLHGRTDDARRQLGGRGTTQPRADYAPRRGSGVRGPTSGARRAPAGRSAANPRFRGSEGHHERAPVAARARTTKPARRFCAWRGHVSRTDGVGFEPTVRFQVHTLSRRAP